MMKSAGSTFLLIHNTGLSLVFVHVYTAVAMDRHIIYVCVCGGGGVSP